MKNPNSAANRTKRKLSARWAAEDYPEAEPRFQIMLFAKDVAIFFLLPIFSIIVYKSCDSSSASSKKPTNQSAQVKRDQMRGDAGKSQIIEFKPTAKGSGVSIFGKKSPGSLVKVKLLNVVETYSNAPVHAQVIDAGLGPNLMGGTLIGDAVSDATYERINITFRFARDPNRDNIAVPISARALGLDGTLGLVATKKEGFFARSAINSAGSASQEAQGKSDSSVDLKQVLFKALTAGLVQEFGSETQVERNRSQVLTLKPSTEFFVELTDFFPGGSK